MRDGHKVLKQVSSADRLWTEQVRDASEQSRCVMQVVQTAKQLIWGRVTFAQVKIINIYT